MGSCRSGLHTLTTELQLTNVSSFQLWSIELNPSFPYHTFSGSGL